MRYIQILTLILTSTLVPYSFAWEANLEKVKGEIFLSLDDSPYPKTLLEKELESGLPNHITLMINLVGENKTIPLQLVSVSITYDLWDEHYVINSQEQLLNSANERIENIVPNKNELLEILSHYKVKISGLSEQYLSPGNNYLQVQILVNPVKAERVARIQNWLKNAQSQPLATRNTKRDRGPASRLVSTSNNGIGGRSRGPRFKKLFDQILEQYAASEMPAQWRSIKIQVPLNRAILND